MALSSATSTIARPCALARSCSHFQVIRSPERNVGRCKEPDSAFQQGAQCWIVQALPSLLIWHYDRWRCEYEAREMMGEWHCPNALRDE